MLAPLTGPTKHNKNNAFFKLVYFYIRQILKNYLKNNLVFNFSFFEKK